MVGSSRTAAIFWLPMAMCLVAFSQFPNGPAEERPRRLPATIRREVQKMWDILEENFRACTEASIDALTATLSPALPGQQKFRTEALKTFEETDIYYRLGSIEYIAYEPPFAVARVVQTTLPRNEVDREAGSGFEQAYRSDSALLPPWEQVVYTMAVNKNRGKWLTSEIIKRPAAFPASASKCSKQPKKACV